MIYESISQNNSKSLIVREIGANVSVLIEFLSTCDIGDTDYFFYERSIQPLLAKLDRDQTIRVLACRPANAAIMTDRQLEIWCAENGITPERTQALEHWIVSPWLAEKLESNSEIIGQLFGLNIWGRSTSGQAISMDPVLGEIASDVESAKDRLFHQFSGGSAAFHVGNDPEPQAGEWASGKPRPDRSHADQSGGEHHDR